MSKEADKVRKTIRDIKKIRDLLEEVKKISEEISFDDYCGEHRFPKLFKEVLKNMDEDFQIEMKRVMDDCWSSSSEQCGHWSGGWV